MKKLALLAAVGAGLALSAATSQAQISISSTTGTISISGTTLTVGGGFLIDPPATDFGTLGSFSTGTFTIGTIVNQGGGVQSATLTEGGIIPMTISIGPSGGGTLTGDVSFIQISSSGSVVGLNTLNTVINLSALSYTGTDSVLAALAARPNGILTLTLTGTTDENLSTIVAGSPITDGFQGSLASAVPEPSTIAAGALMLLPLGIGAIRAIRKERTA